MILQYLGIVAAIVLVDLALSGDNALVIGAVASRLKPPQRRFAIVFGGVMAVALRILLAEAAVFVLQVPYIQAIGGLIVLYIAVQLISERRGEDDEAAQTKKRSRFGAQDGLFWASITILFADVSMSLDNVLAVAALAHEHYELLIFGILFSMLLLLVASTLIAKLIERFPVLLFLASAILAWTAGMMVVSDKGLATYFQPLADQLPGIPLEWVVPPIFLVLAFLAWLAVRGIQRLRHHGPRLGDV